MKYDALIEMAIKCMLEYDPIKMTVDSHSEQFIIAHRRQLEDTESVFIKQVFYGTFRYAEFLKVLTDSLFKNWPSKTNRNDWPIYHVFGYLICFRLDELPYHEFKKMVQACDAVKMNVFFEFLFNVDILLDKVKPGWIEIYDEGYIDNDIIGKIEERLPKVAELLASLSEKATGKKSDLVNTLESTLDIKKTESKLKVEKRPNTQAAPFKLTKPKPKKLPEPIKIAKQVERKEVPKNLNKKSLAVIQQEREQQKQIMKQQTEAQYAKKDEFKFQLDTRPQQIDKLKEEAENKFKKQHKYVKTFHRPVPDFSEESDVKLNVAAILREEKHLKDKEKEEEKRIHDLEWNLRDSTEFENWKLEKQHEENIEQLEQKERQRIEMQLAREAAMRACENKVEKNKKTVDEMKKETEIKLKEMEELKKEELEKKQDLIEGVLATRDNATIQKQKIFDQNKAVHDLKIEEMEKLMALKKIEQEEERKKRDELIRQIRELEKQPRVRTSGYDPTETMGIGLLQEMSMVQLRERLEEVKTEQKMKEEQTRQQNMQKKDKFLNSMQRKVELIKENRKNLSQQKILERQQKKQREEEEKQRIKEIKEKSLLTVHSKIKDKKLLKRLEEEKLAKDLREIKLKRQYMNASAALVEEMAWENLQQGAEREIKELQVNKLIDQERIESVKYKERKILAETAKRTVNSKMDFNTKYDEKVEKAQKENEILYRQLREDQKLIVNEIKEYEKAHNANMVERETFKYKISEMSLTNAKRSQEKKLARSKQDQTKIKQQQQLENMDLPGQKYAPLPEVGEEVEQQV